MDSCSAKVDVNAPPKYGQKTGGVVGATATATETDTHLMDARRSLSFSFMCILEDDGKRWWQLSILYAIYEPVS